MNLQEIKNAREEAVTKAITDNKVFFAFSDQQFTEGLQKIQLQEGDKIRSIGAGGYIPKSMFNNFADTMDKIDADYKAAIKNNKLRTKEIIYELYNHECFYTGDIEDCLAALGDDYTIEEVQAVYNSERKNALKVG